MQRENLNAINLHTIDDMRDIIMREKARSDRFSQEFSMIVFEIEKNINIQGFINDLCCFLKSRLRAIDYAGWFADHQIGIVLSFTSAENAAKFAEVIQKANKNTSHAIIVKVFTYPSIWPYKQENEQQNTHIL